MKNNEILIIGSVVLDNVKTPFGEVKEALGGSAVYAAVAASFFTRVKLIGVVGDDFPQKYLKLLEERNIDISLLKIIKGGTTFRWDGWYDWDMHHAHTVSTCLNVFADFSPKVPPSLKNIKYIFLANISPDIQLRVLQQTKDARMVVADTMNYWIDNKPEALKKVIKKARVMLLNDGEARQISSTPNLMVAAKKILKEGANTVIIKKGEHGCLMLNNKEIFCAPGYPLEIIKDPTGAGDTFAGGFIGYLAKEGKITSDILRKAVIYGSILASFNVEDFSLGGLFSLTDKKIEKRYQEFKKLVHFEKI